MNRKLHHLGILLIIFEIFIMYSCSNSFGKGEVIENEYFDNNEASIHEFIGIMEPYKVRNDDYYLLFEQENNGRLILKCWYGGQKEGEPDFILYNGKRIFWDEMANFYEYNDSIFINEYYSPLGEQYIFKTDKEEYRYNNGWYKGTTLHELIIYNTEGDIIYAKDFDNVDNVITKLTKF